LSFWQDAGLPDFADLHWGPQHGYGITLRILSSGELLRVDTGSLYPSLLV